MVALAWAEELDELDGLDELDELDEWAGRGQERAFGLAGPGTPTSRHSDGPQPATHPRGPARCGARRRAASRKFFWRRLVVLCALGVLGVVGWGAAEQVFGLPGAPPAGLEACFGPSATGQTVDLASASSGSPSGASTASDGRRQLDLTGDSASTCPQAYVVRPGDTIWAIAVRFSGGGDPRALAAALEAEIGGVALQPGQVLAVPGDAPLHR